MDLIKRIVTAIIGITKDQDQALEMYLSTLYHKMQGQSITFFFPDDVKLDAINVIGTVPQVGQKIYIHTLLRRGSSDEGKNYDDYDEPWEVEYVNYSLTVPENSRMALKDELWGKKAYGYRAEVKLKKV